MFQEKDLEVDKMGKRKRRKSGRMGIDGTTRVSGRRAQKKYLG